MREWLTAYLLLAVCGLVISAWLWSRWTPARDRYDGRATLIYFAALFGALLGAKLAFLFAEGWSMRADWLALLSGRSITGALLGGYAAVEWAKRRLRVTRTTGDIFALIVPLAVGIGRVGCMLAGCCPGIACSQRAWWTVTDASGVCRWPAPAIELAFQIVFLAWAVLATRYNWLVGNRFHIYLIAYGFFRFGHEFLRDNQHWIGPIGGYHALALAVAALGANRLLERLRNPPAE